MLRTHTSAHQAEIFRQNSEDGWLITSDVYRRDAVDKTHYPIFHQMEGARTWNKNGLASEEVARVILNDLTGIPLPGMKVLDPSPATHKERNPLQAKYHSLQEVEAIAAHLKRSLENAVMGVFDAARESAVSTEAVDSFTKGEIKIRWVEAYFPFTSPSWELEVFWQGDWLEILGCGVIKQELLNNAGVPGRIGWAFGVGLERIAMLLFSIPDIRLFWSRDLRFLSQFKAQASPASSKGMEYSKSELKIAKFVPFSKHPPCYKDVSFWIGKPALDVQGSAQQSFHENDFMEVVRDIAGDLAEEAKLVDDFVHPKTARRSMCYRINYRSLERTLTNTETNNIHNTLCKELERRLMFRSDEDSFLILTGISLTHHKDLRWLFASKFIFYADRIKVSLPETIKRLCSKS